MDPRKRGWGDMDWIHLAQVREDNIRMDPKEIGWRGVD
jgi:hypothetical protein